MSMMRYRMKNIVILCLLCSLLSCKTTFRNNFLLQSAGEGPSPQEITDNGAWNSYVAVQLAGYEHQPSCRPASFLHRGELKGAVILFHEFTSCPQQYFAVAAKLADAGWDVFLPTSPGHGMVRKGKAAEYAKMPTRDNVGAVMVHFIKQMNEVARSHAASQKAVAGVSMGGALATGAIAYAPNLYRKGLIVTPFYKMNGSVANVIRGAKSIDRFKERMVPEYAGEWTEKMLGKEMGWGEGCEERARRGRAGGCRFTLSNLMGVQQFGWELSASQNITAANLQFIGAENDRMNDVARLTWFFSKKVALANPGSSLCFYRRTAHLSDQPRFDGSGEGSSVVPEFEENLVGFITEGRSFATTSAKILNYPECRS
jgi:pimeloyl-ACP methyl ester carboxylesterase